MSGDDGPPHRDETVSVEFTRPTVRRIEMDKDNDETVEEFVRWAVYAQLNEIDSEVELLDVDVEVGVPAETFRRAWLRYHEAQAYGHSDAVFDDFVSDYLDFDFLWEVDGCIVPPDPIEDC